MKNIRIICKLCLCLVMMLFVTGQVSKAQTPSVNDMAGYLSEDEIDELNVRFQDIKLMYNFDVVFVSEDINTTSKLYINLIS